MSETTGSWQEETVAGHLCDVYQPSVMNEAGFVVLFLHGVHLERLVENQHFTEQFERHGLAVAAPMTQRSWWTDRICEEFDPQLTAEQHVLQNVLPYIEQRWGSKSPCLGLLGTSMGGARRFASSLQVPGSISGGGSDFSGD